MNNVQADKKKEVEKKYAVPIKIGNDEPSYNIKDGFFTLSNGIVVEKEKLEEFLSNVEKIVAGNEEKKLNIKEKIYYHMLGVLIALYSMNMLVYFIEKVVLIKFLFGITGFVVLTLLVFGWIFYMWDDNTLIKKRKLALDKIIPNVSSEMLLISLYNKWGMSKIVLTKEQEIMRKAMLRLNKMYLTPGLKMVETDMKKWLEITKLK